MFFKKQFKIILLAIGISIILLSCQSNSNFYDYAKDSDEDGIFDNEDNCINTFNPYQYDKDQDGKGYACDHNIFLRAGIFDPVTEAEKYIPNITVIEETGYYFIQLKEDFNYTYLDDFFESIEATNYDTFEGDVYIIKTDLKLKEIKSKPEVRATGIYQPANRIEPELFLGRFIYENGSLIETNQIIALEIYVYTNKEDIKNKIERFGGVITKESEDIFLTFINQSRLIDIILIPDVSLINPAPILQFENEYARLITGVNFVNEKFKLQGEGEIITIADSGLDTGDLKTLHQDFRGRIINIFDMGTGTKKDLSGHGTHVAASAIGSGSASQGKQSGSAPKAKLIFQAVGNEYPEKVSPIDLQKRQKGGTRPSPIYCFGQAEIDPKEKKILKKSYGAMGLGGIPLDYTSLFKGASIHSNSWATCQGEYTPRVANIDEYIWNNKNTVILFASGNNADFTFLDKSGNILQRGGDSLSNTARAKNVITVGATETSRQIDSKKFDPNKVASFSGKGEEILGRIKPDIVAPGTWILSARSSVCVEGTRIREIVNNEITIKRTNFTKDKCVAKGLPSKENLKEKDQYYFFNSGTSMATPHVAGLVAIIREYYKKIKKHSSPSAALVKATLINGAIDLPDQSSGLKYSLQKNVSCKGYPNMCEGWGLVNIADSIFPGDNHENLWFIDVVGSEIKKTGDSKSFKLKFQKNRVIKITLAWTDPPPEALQNDLDLKVISPSGKVYLGNTFTHNGKQSKENPLVKDPKLNNNVVEKIIIPRSEEGSYTIIVTATKLRVTGSQSFAIVASQK